MVQAALTIGELAERLGAKKHQLRYAILTRQIQPTARAGRAWIYNENDIERIRAALADMATGSKRTGKAAGHA